MKSVLFAAGSLLLILVFAGCSKSDNGYNNPVVTPPAVTTTAISSVTQTTAAGGGTVTSNGGGTVTARGVCWGTSHNPTTANSTTSNGSGTGSFTSSLTALIAATTYYVRAYATNSAGTSYGAEMSFTTLTSGGVSIPSLTTTAISSINLTTAMSGGNITGDGGAAITARGVCWSTSSNPTVANSKTVDGTGSGTFSSSLAALTTNTMYHVRAYATNSAGTSYGNDVSFTTAVSGAITISIVSMTSGFSPGTITVANGTVVTWHNDDAIPHTVTADNGTAFNSGNIAPGGNFIYTANTAGTFGYHCAIHTSMTGSLTVLP